MGPNGQEDPEGSGAGSSSPLEGDVSWGQSPGDSWGAGWWGGRGAEAAFPQLQLCSLDRGLCQGVLLLPSRMSGPTPLPGRMQDWLARLAVPFRTRRAPVLSEAVRDAPRLLCSI